MADVAPYIDVLIIILTDVIVKVADFMATCFGRCYCHYYVRWCYYSQFNLYYDVTYWQMLLPRIFCCGRC